MDKIGIDRDSPVPVYYQIELDLKKRIMRHEWDDQQQLPSEADLAIQYDVSRVTLRQALAELEKDGIIKKYRGKGAFVNTEPIPFVHDLSYVLVSGDRIVQQGFTMTAQVLELELVTDLFDDICESLQIANSESAVYLKRLFLLDGKPTAIGRSWLPASLVPELEKLGLYNNSLSKTLTERYKLTPVKIEDYLEVVRATQSERKLLESSYDSPLILIKGTSYLENGIPLEMSNTLWLGDTVRFHFVLNHTPSGFVMEP